MNELAVSEGMKIKEEGEEYFNNAVNATIAQILYL